MDNEKLQEILRRHQAWLDHELGGERADLINANLIGAGGSRGDMLYAVRREDGIRIKAGCFWGTLAEFEKAVQLRHGDSEHGRYYQAVIAFLKVWEAK